MGWFVLFAFIVILILQLSSGTIVPRGGKAIRRDRTPTAYWIGIGFQIVLIVALLGGLVFIH
jgi:heme A synthase